MTWLLRILRSMLGQMVLLSMVFIIGGMYVLTAGPLSDLSGTGPADPRIAGLSALNGVMADAVRRGGDPTQLAARIDGNPLIQQARQRNAGFQYFAMSGPVRVGTAGPRYLDRSGVAAMIAARRAAPGPGICVRWQRTFRRAQGIDHVGFNDCGRPFYHELRGVVAPAEVAQPNAVAAYVGRVWSYGGEFVLAAAGVLLICIAILLFHIVRIQRIARLVGPSEAEPRARPLSERGLPSELLPLVRAINRMITDGSVDERRRRFFLSAAAHEMRTPLTVLRTRLEMLDDSEDRTKLIADVRRLSTLVNDLLTLTRIGERPPLLVPLRLFGACRRAVEGMDPVAMRQGVTLRIQGRGEAEILGDASLIETAVTNLLGNAIAVTPPGGVVVLSVTSSGALTVRDQGPGIAPERVPEIFEPFLRLSDRHSGYGLGLAIVRAVVDLHDADIEVDAAVGGGTRFTIRFAALPKQ
ncbi:sensor histidine kinase [Sphingomonas sp. Leaf62]|uniref:sensor histidine kinase n=1 Tax=Sphingomonas sp. Leaf62 TaxID=1736228 RepID=UPI0006F36F2A|nr:HAMP domain-containing sensor histidine kinase [Sphingomonas sp. Leaf62]KQN79763.1 hypothetical protein ASE91_13130 [Sphingomonas sp. Leaf62]